MSLPEAPCLIVEATGTAEAVEGDLELVQAIAEAEGALEIVFERDPDARAPALEGPPHGGACGRGLRARAAASGRPTSACPSPSSRQRCRSPAPSSSGCGSRAGSSGMPATATSTSASTWIADDPTALERSDELVRRVVEDALARGGTCSGEHGIGIGKIGALEQEHGDLIALMRGIKQVFDPLGIMNPGKVLREVAL